MSIPLVSIICTSYNHGQFIEDALDSVLNQNYPHIQLIVIDNGSEDDSSVRIGNWIGRRAFRDVRTIFHNNTLNYCEAFNQALGLSEGKYVIDLSGDDVLLEGHVKASVDALEESGSGVCFSNAYLEKKGRRTLQVFYAIDGEGRVL